jgi:hypothetical protein
MRIVGHKARARIKVTQGTGEKSGSHAPQNLRPSRNDRATRSYLCRPRKYRRASWGWTDQQEEAVEFASREEVHHIIEPK